MSPERRLELIEGALEELNNEGKPVIVEGNKDEKSLRELGFDGEIIKVNKGISMSTLCENISETHKNVIILTDKDRTGDALFTKLGRCLKANDVGYDTPYRNRIFSLAEGIKDVESLSTFLKNLRMRVTRP